MTANLNIKDYDGDHYYMWDAQQKYWEGYEWTHNNPLWQPTLSGNTSTFYPQSKAADPTRWFNDTNPSSGPINAQTSFFKTLPNANEMTWYAMKGDPRWDTDKVWTMMGHLYKGGMWLKKKAYISGFSTEHGYDGTTDFRVSPANVSNTSLNPGLPSASDANKYFFLPATGFYLAGKLDYVGLVSNNWSSNAVSGGGDSGAYLALSSNLAALYIVGRFYGFRAQAQFE